MSKKTPQGQAPKPSQDPASGEEASPSAEDLEFGGVRRLKTDEDDASPARLTPLFGMGMSY